MSTATMPSARTRGGEVATEADAYLRLFHDEHGTLGALPARLAEVAEEIERTGTYRHTREELAFGAQVAWRNSTHCIGRLHWPQLALIDARDLTTAEDIFDACVEYLRFATNGGRIRSTLTAFAPQQPGEPGIRIWNSQLIRYAGYRQADGSTVGDPANVELTEAIGRLGWSGEGGPFDVLPLVIELPHEAPRLFELPRDVVLEVPISHPDHPAIAELGLKWHALPAISGMRLEVGGVSYTAAPFNGWYMGTEVGARNLSDESRYDVLEAVAEKLGLLAADRRGLPRSRTLWKDRALVELNLAVLESYKAAGVTMVDHHKASEQFLVHVERERRAGRDTPARWMWIAPPMSGSTTAVWHRGYRNVTLKPNYFPQVEHWQRGPGSAGCPAH